MLNGTMHGKTWPGAGSQLVIAVLIMLIIVYWLLLGVMAGLSTLLPHAIVVP